MKPRDVADLVLLAALWGASFLFLRIAAPAFGPAPLIAIRCGVGAAALLPLLVVRGQAHHLRGRLGSLVVLGATNSAIPFTCFAFATLSLTAGMASILNATAPLFTALVAVVALRERLGAGRALGIAVGFAGVVVLVTGKSSFAAGGNAAAVAACLFATLNYGVAANYTRRRFADVPPLAVAAGSLVAATLLLLPWAWAMRPSTMPSAAAWATAIALGVACTGFAYVLYFRLIQRTGPTRAISVTYLIPVFGTIWGFFFLNEPVTLRMVVGGAIVALGVALATGAVRRFRTAAG